MSIKVIKHFGRPNEATLPDGTIVRREEKIFVPTQQEWYETLDYDNHFVYYRKVLGTTMMCTCGSIAAVFGYDAYQKFASRYKGTFVVGCVAHLQSGGRHSDGSS